MTDGRSDEPDFDDPAHAEVRDLLARARVDEPIPAEVAARLDATLAELSGRSRAGAPDGTADDPVVVPLRPRSRFAPARLLAAASVIVVAGAGAVGLNQVLQNSSGSDAEKSTASAPAPAADSAGGQNQPEVATPENVPTSPDGVVNSRTWRDASSIPVLTAADFAHEARDLDLKSSNRLRQAATLALSYSETSGARKTDDLSSGAKVTPSPNSAQSGDQSSSLDNLTRADAAKARTCTGPKIDGTASYPIVLDGEPAVLVVHPENAGTKLVEAWSCDGSNVLAFTTVPA